ncbi:MAG: hypothetical protein IPF82_19380 [Blastocatellia bacterium]|nr:hypothetical protein [Blastocatellia bacterium]
MDSRALGAAVIVVIVAATLAPAATAQQERPARRTPPLLMEKDDENNGDAGEAERNRQWFFQQRSYPFGTIPNDARGKATAAWKRIEAARSAAEPARRIDRPRAAAPALAWRSIGPTPTEANIRAITPVSGRVMALAVSPIDANLVLAGSAGGGIWRSTDAGVTYAPVSDDQIDLSVGAIAFAQSDPSIVYAAMGEEYVSSGVLKSTDAGRTWSRVSDTSLPTPGLANDIEVDPRNPNRVYLAQYAGISEDGQLRAAGFFLSTDGGRSWSRRLAGLPREVTVDPANPDVIYLAMSRVDEGDDRSSGLWKSTNSGQSWSHFYHGPFDAARSLDVAIAVTPAEPNRISLFLAGTIGGAQTSRTAVSTTRGQSWDVFADSILERYGAEFLVADPLDAQRLYIGFGGSDAFRSTNGGQSWACLSGGYCDGQFGRGDEMHVDMHSFAIAPGPGGRVHIGGDGGIYSSDDGGSTLVSRNQTLSLVTFRSIAIHPSNPAISFGGTQDNGTQRRDNGGDGWTEIITGDGNGVVFNPLNPDVFFTTYVYGTIFRWRSFGNEYLGNVADNSTFGESQSSPRIAFYPPFVGNGATPRLYFGTWRLFVSDDLGESWNVPAGTKDLTKGGFDTLSAIGVSASNPDVIYTGSSQGKAYVSDDAGLTWRDVTAGLPDRFITWIAVDRSNPSVAWLTLSGFRSGHVFKTTNMGATWTDVSGQLPDIPANAALQDPLDPNTVYVATDIGVFRSTAGGSGWESLQAGMPATLCIAMASHPSGIVQVATYGRGAYELGVAKNPDPDYALVATPAAVTVARNEKVPFSIDVSRVAGFAESVTVSGPANLGFKGKLKPKRGSTTGTAIAFELKVKRNAVPGTYQVVFEGRSDSGLLKTAALSVTIQ